MIKILQRLKDSGDLKKLIQAGLLSPKIVTYLEVYEHYQQLCEKTDLTMEQKVEVLKARFKVCRATVYNSIKKMQS